MLQGKEDDETDGITRVQTGSQNIQPKSMSTKKKHTRLHEMQKMVLTVVLGSPAKLALTDGMVKGIAGEEPGYIVER